MESKKGAHAIDTSDPPCAGYIVDGMFYGTLYEAAQYGPPGAAKRAKKIAEPIQYVRRTVAPKSSKPKPNSRGFLSDAERARRHRARVAVAEAVRHGILPAQHTQACSDCGVTGLLAFIQYDHYMGYEDAYFLAVEPVCRACHGRRTAAETAVRRANADAGR